MSLATRHIPMETLCIEQNKDVRMHSSPYIDTEIDQDLNAIPFQDVIYALNNAYPYGSNKRLALVWRTLVGARSCEIENRKVHEIVLGRYWVWKPRKNQKGMRKEKLPDWFLNELEYYFRHAKFCEEDIFGITGESLTRNFNKYVRPKLGGNWIKKRPEFYEDGSFRMVYKYQLKNLRHNFQTLIFWNELKQGNGPEVALARTARRMKHSSTNLTSTYYLECAKALDMERYGHYSMDQIVSGEAEKDHKRKVQQTNILFYIGGKE